MKDNKGFSLVELIIVIAIMAVLVGVLAPQFIKYVEQSRRSRDIQTAQEIRESVLAAIADNRVTGNGSNVALGTGALTVGSAGSVDTIASVPTVAGHVTGAGTTYNVSYNANTGTCSVSVGSYDLTTEGGASAYRAAS
jgi:prepilin-type N-terminal cleavage/methylation domain-containing protein